MTADVIETQRLSSKEKVTGPWVNREDHTEFTSFIEQPRVREHYPDFYFSCSHSFKITTI